MTDIMEIIGTCIAQQKPRYPGQIDMSDQKLPEAAGYNRRWSKRDDIFLGASESVDQLPPGFYTFGMSDAGVYLKKSKLSVDSLLRLPDTHSELVLNEFSEFWTLRDKFTSRGILFKRGYLLWGSPGGGKTASLMLMSEEIINKHGGIVCMVDNPYDATVGLGLIRKIEPNRPIVALIEDLDALIDRYGETQFLSLLDGESQIDGIVYIGTTNYPEKLDKRFVDRPSRFDTIRWIGMPSPEARKMYLSTKEPSLTEDELGLWVKRTEGFAISHLRELIILVKCFGKTLDDALLRLEKMRQKPPNSGDQPDKQSFGFGR